MVIAKPMQLTMVNDVPLDSGGAFCATSVENKGESAMTVTPHMKRKAIKNDSGDCRKNGDNKQQAQEMNKAPAAIFFAPYRCDNHPLTMQAGVPDAIIRKEKSGTFNWYAVRLL